MSASFKYLGLCLCLIQPGIASAFSGYDQFVTSSCAQASRPVPKFTTNKCNTCHSSNRKAVTPAVTAYRAGGARLLDYFCPASVSLNHAPSISIPTNNQTVIINTPVSFTVTAQDQDAGDVISLSADISDAQGASFNSANGQFTWTPSAARDTAYQVAFSATDKSGLKATTIYSLTVTSTQVVINHKPVIIVPNILQNVTIGHEISFEIRARDSDGDSIDLISVNPPTGSEFSKATFDSNTSEWVSVFRWTPVQIPSPNPILLSFTASDLPAANSNSFSSSDTVSIMVNDVESATTSAIQSLNITSAKWDRKTNRLSVFGLVKPLKGQKISSNIKVSLYDGDSGLPLAQTIPVSSKGTWQYSTDDSLVSVPCSITAKAGGLTATVQVKSSCIDNTDLFNNKDHEDEDDHNDDKDDHEEYKSKNKSIKLSKVKSRDD